MLSPPCIKGEAISTCQRLLRTSMSYDRVSRKRPIILWLLRPLLLPTMLQHYLLHWFMILILGPIVHFLPFLIHTPLPPPPYFFFISRDPQFSLVGACFTTNRKQSCIHSFSLTQHLLFSMGKPQSTACTSILKNIAL